MTKTTINRRNLMLSTGSGALSLPVLAQRGLGQSSDELQVDIRQIERPDFPDVSVFATVKDASGTVLTDLDELNFQIQEDGSRNETIAEVDQPDGGSTTTVATSIVIDRSGSMTGVGRTRLEDAKSGANEFISNFEGGDQGQVIAFDSSNSIEIIQRWTQDTSALTNAVDSITAGGSTALYDTVITAVEEASGRVGRSAVIVLADGQDNSSTNSIGTAIERANQENVPVYTIGLGDTLDPDALEQIATETGAEFYASADDGDLEGIYQSISESLGNEYKITYQTRNNTTDANERTVELTATAGGDSGSDTDSYTEPCAPLPTAIFDIPDEVRLSDTVSFDGSGSDPNGGQLVSYEWDFTNDGVTNETGQTATHSYSDVGNYEARLTVKKTCGAQDVTTQPIFVFEDPISVYIKGTNSPIEAGQTLKVQVEVENAGTSFQAVPVSLLDFDGNSTETVPFSAERGTRTELELEWETEVGDADTDDITVQIRDRSASETVEITAPEPDADIEIDETRTGTTVNSPVTVQVQSPTGDGYEYHWKVKETPVDSDPYLLHGEGEYQEPGQATDSVEKPHAVFRPQATGSYELRVDVFDNVGNFVGSGTTEIEVGEKELKDIGKDEDGNQQYDVSIDSAETVAELVEQYAPIYHFHKDEQYYPTRIEAFVENSDLIEYENSEHWDTTETPMWDVLKNIGRLDPLLAGNITLIDILSDEFDANTVVESPSMYDIGSIAAGSQDRYDLYLQDSSDSSLINVQEQYPRTIYANVHKTNFNQEDHIDDPNKPNGQYIAITYWAFYLFDPKEGESGSNSLLDQFKALAAQHASDTETVTILVDEDGPQWVAAAQHYNGEYMQWEKVAGTDKASSIDIYPSKGAHSSFLVNTEDFTSEFPAHTRDGQHKDKIPGQLRWNPEWVPGDDYTTTFAGAWSDTTGSDETWSYATGLNTRKYELVVLTDDEDWSNFEGEYFSSRGVPKVEGGQIPQARGDRFNDSGSWIPDRMIPESDVLHAKLFDFVPEPIFGYFQNGPIGTPSSFNIVGFRNTGVKPHTFVTEVKITATETDETWNKKIETNLGWHQQMSTISDLTQKIPLDDLDIPSSGWIEAEAKVLTYPSSIATDADIVYEETVTALINLNPFSIGSVNAFSTNKQSVTPGETVERSRTITNEGQQTDTVLVTLTAIDSNGNRYMSDDGGYKTATLDPAESKEVLLDWTPSTEVAEGDINLLTEIWAGDDIDDRTARLDERVEPDAVTVSKPKGSISISTTPSDATVIIDGEIIQEATVDRPVGSYDITAVHDEFGSINESVTVEEDITQQVHLDVTNEKDGVERYANNNGVVRTDGLRDAINDWRNDDISTPLLRDVIDAWRNSDQTANSQEGMKLLQHIQLD